MRIETFSDGIESHAAAAAAAAAVRRDAESRQWCVSALKLSLNIRDQPAATTNPPTSAR